jgi:hypothetical protein
MASLDICEDLAVETGSIAMQTESSGASVTTRLAHDRLKRQTDGPEDPEGHPTARARRPGRGDARVPEASPRPAPAPPPVALPAGFGTRFPLPPPMVALPRISSRLRPSPLSDGFVRRSATSCGRGGRSACSRPPTRTSRPACVVRRADEPRR